MANTNFVYPDVNDATTVAYISKESLWDKDESDVLSYAISFVKKGNVFVDAGCGFGRLIPEFAQYFDKVIGIEPDLQRITKAKQAVTLAKLSTKVEFIHLPVEEVTIQDVADLVLSSHIIQHISAHSASSVLVKMANMLKHNGLLILTTSNSPSKSDRFVKCYVRSGEVVEEEIADQAFENLIGKGDGVLPVHQFATKSLYSLLEHSGFTVIGQQLFHKNASYPTGRDILLVATVSK